MTSSIATPITTDVPSANEREILNNDIDDIYLGNLGTVEVDLNLPATGKRGSTFRWTSGERLFLSDEGKVTRPTFGVGDRDVPLYLTATYGSSTENREYTVTVIQEQPQTTIVSVDDAEIVAFVGCAVTLPAFVVVHLSDGNSEVRSVVWNEPSQIELTEANAAQADNAAHATADATVGTIDYATGHIEGWNEPVTAKVTFVYAHPEAAQRKLAQSLREGFVRSHAKVTDDGVLGRKLAARIDFLRTVDEGRMLYNFRQAAGLDVQGAEPMTGWDNPEGNLRGHTTGHFLSGLALAYSCTGDSELRAKIDRMVSALAECQQALHEHKGYSQGFLSGYSEEQFDLLEEYVTYPTIWAPYYTFDKIVSGLLDCYEYAGSEQALDIALKMGFWVNRRLGRLTKSQRDRMWSIYIAGEYGGIISALIRLYRITGDSRFASTASYFHNDKLLYPMERNVDTLGGMHANQHIPQIIGALDCATFAGDLDGLTIARDFWNMVTEHHMYAIGGVGETEMFRAPDKIAAYLTDKSAESCATYNLSKLSMKLFETDPRASYADYYERALLNDLLPATHSEPDGGTVYFFPTRPGGHLSFDTDENTCCHGTGFENMFRFEENIVKGTRNTAYVNLYIPSQVEACEGAFRCNISRAGELAYTIVIERDDDVRIALRRPIWATGMHVSVDGCAVSVHEANESGYVIPDASLNVGSRIDVSFDTTLGLRATPDDPTVVALTYGPYVLAALSGSTEFLTVQRSAIEEIAQSADSLRSVLIALSETAGVPCKPIDEVCDEPYHVYLRMVA